MNKEILEILRKRQCTKYEFENLLESLKGTELDNIRYTLTDSLGNSFEYGKQGNGEVDKTETVYLKNGYKVKIEIWTKRDSCNIKDYIDVFKEFWNDTCSDKTTGFPTTEHQSFLDKCNNTLRYYHEKSQNIALVMIDLDHFREVNNNNDHETGSKVLGEFAQVLFSVVINQGIMIHQTGDEFNVILPYDKLENVIGVIKEAHDKVKDFKFSVSNEIKLSMAVGIKCLENEQMDYITARNAAEKIYSNSNRKNSIKQRDSIRIDYNGNIKYGKKNLKLAWTRLICNLDKSILGNSFLEFIRGYSLEVGTIEEFKSNINEIIDWINPDWDDNIRCTANYISYDAKATFSYIELCLAILQGFLKNSHFIKQNFILKCENKSVQIYMDNEVIFEKSISFDIDSFVGKCEDFYRTSKNCKRILLLQAGYDSVEIPKDVFYKIIRVDTRPTTGGGLPDFWAAALCELVTNVKENPNISDVLIYGETRYTKNIVEVLDSIDNWKNNQKYNFKYISQKTFKSVEDIREFQEKFKNHIIKCDDEKELCKKVCKIYEEEVKECETGNVFPCVKKRRILERNLSYDKIALGVIDGCRVNTIAEAYPTVLEILRHQYKEETDNIKDQAGRSLLELTDFKILLLSPSSKDLPDYYIDDEKQLKEYYEKILGNEDSLFKKEMKKGNQFDALIKHVQQAITNQNNYATRRAILIVAKEVDDEDNFSPLGLISVWLAPRFVKEQVVIDFSYNWRTVEAVVGLPLSMYASVRFAEDMLEIIKNGINNNGLNIRLGVVSYIAHSLHMFLDEESMNIVRGIVNDASI